MNKLLLTLFVSTVGLATTSNFVKAENDVKTETTAKETGKKDSIMPTINKDVVQGNWEIVKGKIKEKWANLTDNDLLAFEGKAQQLAGILQKKYGLTLEEAQKQADKFLEENNSDDANKDNKAKAN